MYQVLTAPTDCVTRFDTVVETFKTQKQAVEFAKNSSEKNIVVWQGQGFTFCFTKLDGEIKHRYQGDFMGYPLAADSLGEITKQVKEYCKEIKANGAQEVMESHRWHDLCEVESKIYSPSGVERGNDTNWLAITINKALPKSWQSTGEKINKAFPV